MIDKEARVALSLVVSLLFGIGTFHSHTHSSSTFGFGFGCGGLWLHTQLRAAIPFPLPHSPINPYFIKWEMGRVLAPIVCQFFVVLDPMYICAKMSPGVCSFFAAALNFQWNPNSESMYYSHNTFHSASAGYWQRPSQHIQSNPIQIVTLIVLCVPCGVIRLAGIQPEPQNTYTKKMCAYCIFVSLCVYFCAHFSKTKPAFVHEGGTHTHCFGDETEKPKPTTTATRFSICFCKHTLFWRRRRIRNRYDDNDDLVLYLWPLKRRFV